MTDDILAEVRSATGLKHAIMGGVSLTQSTSSVFVQLITDTAYSQGDFDAAYSVVRKYVPEQFSLELQITKLKPDCEIVKRAVCELLREKFPAQYAVTGEGGVTVEMQDDGFKFTIAVLGGGERAQSLVSAVENLLKKRFCGNFYGCVSAQKPSAENIVVEREAEEDEFYAPPRTFPVEDFSPIESAVPPACAVYMADFDYISENSVVCGRVVDIAERSYTKRNGEEKPYFVLTLTDGTATLRFTYFARKKSVDKVRDIKEGESLVCTCKSEVYNGSLRYTATNIDYGAPPKDFVPQNRRARPVPNGYHTIKPQPYTDFTQGDLFKDATIPACFANTSFVVFDLETTGLSTVPVAGEMDGIIEIGAYKVIDGEIREKFCTFVNPERSAPLDDRIVELTGITDEVVRSAPSYKQVLPDFVKFCHGSVLVGHNAVGFDFKFIDHYCKELGFVVDGRVIDTLHLAQKLLRLSNYKLNTVAEHFGFTFNHHRAEDDALATAKIFIELIKIKKSFPDNI